MVLFTIYSDMLGEFYIRGLLFLWLLSQQVTWLRNAQLYLHLYQPSKSLLDSHHLFTSPFRNHALLDFTTLLDETPCTCLPRLVLCGYERKRGPDGVLLLEPDPNGGQVPIIDFGVGTTYRDLRNQLQQTLIESNPHVQADVRLYRQLIFEQHGIDASVQHEYKIVGLAQRKGRRKWVNFTETKSEIQQRLVAQSFRIVVTEMNVEDATSSSYQQVVRHGAMDALIGIHGAHLTEAIWMPPHSWIVELLPYIPNEIPHGSWTKATTAPTPLGTIFDGTSLNHVGYPLQRDNAPYCYDEPPNLDCWRIDANPWDNRDFVVSVDQLEKIIVSFLTKPLVTCADFVAQAADHYVLYNVNCAEAVKGDIAPHHYYREMKQPNFMPDPTPPTTTTTTTTTVDLANNETLTVTANETNSAASGA
jgi:Glycosyltransferase 61